MDIYQGQEAFAREHHGYCDSYFVESHEDQERRRRDDIRECERQRKRNTQVALAQHLSDLASQEYRDEHLREMEKMEVGTMLLLKAIKAADIPSSTHFQMLHPSIFRPKSNGT